MRTTQIPLEELVVDRYYVGRGRHANVGLWTGHYFQTIGEKFGTEVVKRELYYTEETGCFQPFRLLDDGTVIETVGTGGGWDAHYARVLEFADDGVATVENRNNPVRHIIERHAQDAAYVPPLSETQQQDESSIS